MVTPSLTEILLLIPALLLGLTMHEFAHGLVAHLQGDPTPQKAGRLSLNPVHHLDLWGSIFLLMFRFGWAKPVPVNAAYFKSPRRGMMWVGLAGPGANLLLAMLAGLLFRVIPSPSDFLALSLLAMIQINVVLAIFNLIPVPPLDGSRVLAYFLSPAQRVRLDEMEQYGLIFLMIILLFFREPLFAVINPVIGFFVSTFAAVSF